jgi:hypothetical protein
MLDFQIVRGPVHWLAFNRVQRLPIPNTTKIFENLPCRTQYYVHGVNDSIVLIANNLANEQPGVTFAITPRGGGIRMKGESKSVVVDDSCCQPSVWDVGVSVA